MQDIQNREDILLIMRSFYDKLLADPSISYLFTEVAKINLEEHLPVLVDFWDSMLFGTQKYKANAMQTHIDLAKRSLFSKAHFETWLRYLFASIDDNYDGINAHTMKARAQNIAGIMEFKVAAH
jgi:hemoglobin